MLLTLREKKMCDSLKELLFFQSPQSGTTDINPYHQGWGTLLSYRGVQIQSQRDAIQPSFPSHQAEKASPKGSGIPGESLLGRKENPAGLRRSRTGSDSPALDDEG